MPKHLVALLGVVDGHDRATRRRWVGGLLLSVIAVSHDDRFFDRADHLIGLERGRVTIDREQSP